jgi:hypothetical protein
MSNSQRNRSQRSCGVIDRLHDPAEACSHVSGPLALFTPIFSCSMCVYSFFLRCYDCRAFLSIGVGFFFLVILFDRGICLKNISLCESLIINVVLCET